MSPRFPVAFIALTALSLACSDSTGPTGPNVTGHWVGAASGSGITFVLTITDSAGAISGGGTLQLNGASLGVTIQGSHRKNTVSFNINSPGFESASYSGTIDSPTRISGTLHQSGLDNRALNLTKQTT